MNTDDIDNEDSNVVISQDTFEKRSENILTKMAEFFFFGKNRAFKNQSTEQIIRNHYKGNISTHNISDEEEYEAIPLNYFIKDLSEVIRVKVETIDIYCIFTRLKYSEDYETVDLKKVITELRQFNTEDENLNLDINPPKGGDKGSHLKMGLNTEEDDKEDNLFTNLNRLLREKGISFDIFIADFDKFIKIENDFYVMAYRDFISLMYNNEIITTKSLSQKTMSLISDSPDIINISSLKKIITKISRERPVSGTGVITQLEQQGTVRINEDENVPNMETKPLNESTNKKPLEATTKLGDRYEGIETNEKYI